MADSIARRAAPAHVLLSDVRPVMAKVHSSAVRNADSAQLFAQLGACIEDVRCDAKLTLDEFAHALGKDDRQVARWIKGEDRPQLETVFAVERFRAPLLVALAGLAPEIRIVTTLTFERIA